MGHADAVDQSQANSTLDFPMDLIPGYPTIGQADWLGSAASAVEDEIVTGEDFDQWYAQMSTSTGGRDELVHQHLGLPPEVGSASSLSFEGLVAVRDLLALSAHDVLLDLACGRGGYGLWLARESGARLVGVDVSPVALEQARQRVAAFGLSSQQAEFGVGNLEAVGLPDASVDAVVCVDSIQFAGDITRAAAEMCRVLRPGGKVAVTCWEAVDRADERVPQRMRGIDLNRQLRAGGLVEVTVEEHPDWTVAEENMWKAAVATDPGGDAALQSLKDEGERVLPLAGLIRRILATGRAPLVGSAHP
jgi:SAM-dependent methyltransferase